VSGKGGMHLPRCGSRLAGIERERATGNGNENENENGIMRGRQDGNLPAGTETETESGIPQGESHVGSLGVILLLLLLPLSELEVVVEEVVVELVVVVAVAANRQHGIGMQNGDIPAEVGLRVMSGRAVRW